MLGRFLQRTSLCVPVRGFLNTAARPHLAAPPNSLLAWFQQLQVRGKQTLKTNKSVAKRFRIKGNGDLKRSKAGRSHNTGYKTRSRCNRLAQSAPISNKKLEQKMKQCLGIS